MRKIFSKYQHIFFLAILSTVLIMVVCFYETKLHETTEILFAGDVGISQILDEQIISARFDSLHPYYNFKYGKLSDIRPLLDTLSSAVFLPVDKPAEPLTWRELIYIETDKGTYAIGATEGRFTISINGEYSYYRCSAKDIFLKQMYEIREKLRPIQ